MTAANRRIDRSDVMTLADYAPMRQERHRAMSALKRTRRVSVGPDVTFYFECYETMWHQVHEMLFVEKGGEAQVADELAAYNPLIPQGQELVATVMIEIEDPERRRRTLAELGGIEAGMALTVGDATATAVSESDVERTTEEGKTSAVHFVRFPLTPAMIQAFRTPGTRAVLAVRHPRYDHASAIPEEVRAALSRDFV